MISVVIFLYKYIKMTPYLNNLMPELMQRMLRRSKMDQAELQVISQVI